MKLKETIRRILREDLSKTSNFDTILKHFKSITPKSYEDKIEDVFEKIKNYINEEGFNIKVLNNCETGFKGVRTKNFIIICSPTSFNTISEFIYILFHEIQHEIQMGKLKQKNPMSGEIEDFEELYKLYWEMEIDAHNYGMEWVKKLGNELNLPKQHYQLSDIILNYPSMGHSIRNMMKTLHKQIQQMKRKGMEYSDIVDLPIVKKHMDKIEDLF